MLNTSLQPVIQDAVFPNGSLISANWSDNLLGCDEWQAANHPVFQVANAVVFVGLLAPDWQHGVLFLHSTFVIGFILLSAWSWVILCAPDFFSWNFAFVVINIVQTLFLLYRLRQIRFPKEFEDLYATVFQPMKVSRSLFKKLVDPDIAILSSLAEGDCYAVQSASKTDKLGLLLNGIMQVYSHDNVLHFIHPKDFIDSPEFESSVTGEEKYQVSIIAGTDCQYVCWPRQSFEFLLMKEPFLAHVINTIIGRDIANKLYDLNDRVKDVDASGGRKSNHRGGGAADCAMNHDLRKTLAQFTLETMKSESWKVKDDLVEVDREEEELHSLLDEQIDLLNGNVLPQRPNPALALHSDVSSTHSDLSGIHFTI